MSIIVEGPDGSGKTTLIRMILGYFPTLQLQERVVGKDTKELIDLQTWVEKDNAYYPWTDLRLYDRHRLISEMIYGPILRARTMRPGFNDLDWLSEQLDNFYARGNYLIYCLPPFETVEKNVWQGEDNSAVREYTPQIYQAYCMRAALDTQKNYGNIAIWDYTLGNSQWKHIQLNIAHHLKAVK